MFVPVPEAGHILPMLPIARRLAAGGCSVSFFTSFHFAAELNKQGFAVDTYTELSGKPWPEQPLYAPRIAGRLLWEEEWHSVTSHTSISEMFLSRLRKIASIREVSLAVVDRLFHRSPNGVMDKFRLEIPVVFLSTSLLYSKKDLVLNDPTTIVLCPPEILPAEHYSRFSRIIFAEPSIDFSREDVFFELSAVRAPAPLVLCAFGSQTSHRREMANRLKVISSVAQISPDIQFVVGVGHPQPDYLTMNLPRLQNTNYYPAIPQLSLLSRASLLITHGGLGSIKEAIYMGVPMLCWPLYGDQSFNSGCIKALQLGDKVGGESMTPNSMLAQISALMSSGQVRSKLARFQEMFRERESNPTAAARLYEMA